MQQNLLIPLGNLYSSAGGLVEKYMYYCVDFVCSFVLQDKDPKTREEVGVLFSTYLDMLVENECEDEERAMTESMAELMQVPQMYEFVWRLYVAMYPYLAPILKKAEWYIYTMDHLQIINNNLFVQLDLDGDEENPCLPPNLPPFSSSI
jgi:hypothetical protein